MDAHKSIIRIIEGLDKCIKLGGPGIIHVVPGVITDDSSVRVLNVYEAPTELICGPMDGAEVFYGYAFRLPLLNDYANVANVEYQNNEDGVALRIECAVKDCQIKTVFINVLGDPPESCKPGQCYNTISEEFTPIPHGDEIIAVLK